MENQEKKSRWNFDKWADRYDTTIKEAFQSNDWMYKDYEKILEEVVTFSQDILERPQLVVVDIGVGTGNLAQKFVGRVKRLIGIDPSSKMLRLAKEKIPKIETKRADFLELPLSNVSADLIVSSYAFHHLTEKEKTKALEEMSRVLKKYGKIIIADLMFANQKAEREIKSKLIAEGKSEIVEEIEEEYYSYVDVLKHKFAELGFSTQEKQMSDFVWVICGTR